MNKVLAVLGASGLTGYKAMQLARKRFDSHGTYNKRNVIDKTLIKLDITKEEEVKNFLAETKPDIVLNTTALHNVDYCEAHQDEAYMVNSKAVGFIADACNNLGSRLVHISTDFVFDGRKSPYTEFDTPNPLSVYARSKLEGENLVKKCSSYSIVRPSVVYGWTPLETQGSTTSSGKPMNFALWALTKMNNHEELKIVSDQYTSPTLADILAAVSLRIANVENNEIYHVAGTSCMSRYEFTKKIASTMGYLSDGIVPIESQTLRQAASRPIQSCLNCDKLQNELGYKLPSIEESLSIMRSQIEIESPALLGN
ncbi:MAG: dTDP-4-dehydrorhamnose reductase [Thermoproteota archaeon]|nr:dTDP-4-dehydrorhamnose reductase [Thermoproteota archaeon]